MPGGYVPPLGITNRPADYRAVGQEGLGFSPEIKCELQFDPQYDLQFMVHLFPVQATSLISQVLSVQKPLKTPQLFIRQGMTTSTPPFTMLNAEGDRRSSAWRTVRICFIVELLRVNIRPIIVGHSFDRRKLQIIFTKTKYIQKNVDFFAVCAEFVLNA